MSYRKVSCFARRCLSASLRILDRHRYAVPLFSLRESFVSFQRHNGFSLAAALSFYAMFALIPMVLLIFFLLSHFAVSSHYAIVKLAILVSNLVPKYSNRIMIEVYNIAKHKAVWGIFGMIALFWAATPLAGALRSAFFTIARIPEQPSYLKRKFEDVLGVIGILALFFLFTFSGLMLEKALGVFSKLPWFASLINWAASLVISTISIALFYRTFSPSAAQWKHILIGSFVTALLWTAMRPAFSLFLVVNHSYGTIFGGMKNLFLSIGWLYYGFVVFLIGTEIIAALHKRDVLLLRGLFTGMPSSNKDAYHHQLMDLFGRNYRKDQIVFKEGDAGNLLFYVLSGEITLWQCGQAVRSIGAGDYFGEMAFLTGTARKEDAIVGSETAKIIAISPRSLETLMLEEPKVAMRFLKEMALRYRESKISEAV